MTTLRGAVDGVSRPEPMTSVRLRGHHRGRVAVRVLGTGVWSALCGAWFALGTVCLWFFPGSRRRWESACVRRWGAGIARLLGMRITVEGPPPVPPYVLVSNHLSYLDIILFASAVGPTFVSRHDLRYWPGLGTLARMAGTVFIDRARKRHAFPVMEQIRRRLGQGHGIVLFAEGTSSKGDRVYPMRSSLLEVAAREGRPVYYAAITYRTPPGEEPAFRSVCWWGDMEFAPHFLELCRLPHVEASVRFGREPIEGTDRKALAAKLRRAIADRFEPVVASEHDQITD